MQIHWFFLKESNLFRQEMPLFGCLAETSLWVVRSYSKSHGVDILIRANLSPRVCANSRKDGSRVWETAGGEIQDDEKEELTRVITMEEAVGRKKSRQKKI